MRSNMAAKTKMADGAKMRMICGRLTHYPDLTPCIFYAKHEGRNNGS